MQCAFAVLKAGTRANFIGKKAGTSKGLGNGKGFSLSEPPETTTTLADLGVDKKWAARAGEMLREMAKCGERAKGGGDLRKELRPATLSDFGVTKTQSSRWQKLAVLAEQRKEFVQAVKALEPKVSNRALGQALGSLIRP